MTTAGGHTQPVAKIRRLCGDYLMDRGVDPAPVFSASGLDYTNNEEHDTPLPVERVGVLFEQGGHMITKPWVCPRDDFHYECAVC